MELHPLRFPGVNERPPLFADGGRETGQVFYSEKPLAGSPSARGSLAMTPRVSGSTRSSFIQRLADLVATVPDYSDGNGASSSGNGA